MLESFYGVVHDLFQSIDYWAVFVMMTIEASIIPFPSEIPMIAVGLQTASGSMNPFLGLFVALGGVFVGTTTNYLIGLYLGDVFMERYGKYFGISKKKYHKAQHLFQKDANFYTFFGRLIPVVRQIISIPAGMAHMPYPRFIILSLSGSALWLSILITLGYFVGDNVALIKQYTLVFTVCILLVAGGIFFVFHRKELQKMLQPKK